MQFKIPQDVQRADKIVGPLTMKQLIICSIGGAIAYSLQATLSKQYVLSLWLPPVAFVALLTAAIAFLKIHEIPFLRFVLFYAEYKLKPSSRTWQKMGGEVFISSFTRKKEAVLHKDEEDKGERDRKKLQNLEEITHLVDTHGQDFMK